jgi:bacillolysin
VETPEGILYKSGYSGPDILHYYFMNKGFGSIPGFITLRRLRANFHSLLLPNQFPMFHKYHAVAWLAMSTATLPHLASAQDGSVARKEIGRDGQPTLIQFSPAGRANARAANGELVIRQQLALGTNDQLKPVRTETDQLGFSHQKFEQYYKGVKVEHATYTAHSRGGQIEALSGDFEQVAVASVTPSLSADAALAKAMAFVGAKRYMWQDAREEAGLKVRENDPAASYKPAGELVLVRDARQDAETGPLVLAWKLNVYAQQPVSRAYIYVDAHSGEVVLQDNIIKHTTHSTKGTHQTTAAATASFATAYSGTRSLTNETTTGGYRLREYTRGLGIETYNCKKGSSYTAATDFVDADNSWTEYNNANYDNVAGDAHFGAQSTYDYWKAVFGRNSYDNAGAKIKSYVHFDDTPGDGVGFENAYWDGVEMTYGDGASTFKPLTALDVCGHEIGHAVCEKTANLTYSGESGAMNEGLSDIWGASVEKYTVDKLALTGKSTYLIGEEIMKAGGALRSMSSPGTYSQPAYYKGSYWYAGTADNGGVHTNSGVLNYWYYLISAGKTGTNEKGASFAVTAIGLTDAAKITFRMESVYMTASSTYANARTYSIQAATDLFGATSPQTQSVTNAWAAVGIGAAYGGTTTPPASTTYCTSQGGSQAYEYIDYVKLGTIARTSGADAGYYNGTASSTSVAAGSSQTVSFSAGFTGSAYTEYWKVYIDYNQNGVFTDSGELVVSGSSSSAATLSSTFTVPTTAKTGNTRMRVIVSDNSATTSCGSYSYGETEDYTVSITGGAAIAAAQAPASLAATALSGDAVLSLYPNPALTTLTLSLSSQAELTKVEVLDARGARVSAARYLGQGQLDVSGLAGGLYLLRASDGQHTFVQRFAKQ